MSIYNTVAVYDGETVVTGRLKDLFPNVSFPKSGPDADWKTANGVYDIQAKSFESDQKSTAVTPYYEDGAVYNNTVSDKTQEEIDTDAASALAEAKTSKDYAITVKFAEKVSNGFIYSGNTYQIDMNSQLNMSSTQSRFNNGVENSHGGYWRNKNNEKVTLNDAEVQALFDAAFEYKASLIRHLHDLKDDVAEAADISAVEAIDVSVGWPTNE